MSWFIFSFGITIQFTGCELAIFMVSSEVSYPFSIFNQRSVLFTPVISTFLPTASSRIVALVSTSIGPNKINGVIANEREIVRAPFMSLEKMLELDSEPEEDDPFSLDDIDWNKLE